MTTVFPLFASDMMISVSLVDSVCAESFLCDKLFFETGIVAVPGSVKFSIFSSVKAQ